MKTTRIEMIVRAQTPIAHHQETIGNQAILMRKKVRVKGGSIRLVPFITGNTIRHQLREAAVYATLDAAGLIDADGSAGFSRGAGRLMFNGGGVNGKGDAANVNIDRYRELVSLFPPLAILGGCTDSRILPGQLIIDEGNLLCTENFCRIPDWIKVWLEKNNEGLLSQRALVEEHTSVRSDFELSPEKVRLLSHAAQAEVNGRHMLKESARETGDSKEIEKNKSSMMPFSYERIVEGSLFWWGVECRTHDALEDDAFKYIVACLLSNFRVGGKQGVGHGKLQLVAGAWGDYRPRDREMVDIGTTLGMEIGSAYRDHVRANADRLKTWLNGEVDS